MNRGKQLAIVAAVLAGIVLVGTTSLAVVFQRGPFADAEGDTGVPISTEPLDLGPVIATVNGRPVYLGEARSRIEGIATLHGDVEEVLGDDWHEVILASLVSDQVLREEAEARGLGVTDADIASSVAEVQEMVGEGQTFEGWLSDQEMSYAEFQRRIELQLIGSRVYLAVTEDVKVTGAEIRNYYQANQAEFTGTDGHVSTLLEVKASIRDGLLKDKQDLAYAEWLEEAKADAAVEVVIEDWWRDLA